MFVILFNSVIEGCSNQTATFLVVLIEFFEEFLQIIVFSKIINRFQNFFPVFSFLENILSIIFNDLF